MLKILRSRIPVRKYSISDFNPSFMSREYQPKLANSDSYRRKTIIDGQNKWTKFKFNQIENDFRKVNDSSVMIHIFIIYDS